MALTCARLASPAAAAGCSPRAVAPCSSSSRISLRRPAQQMQQQQQQRFRRRSPPPSRRHRLPPLAAIKGIESFDGAFTLDTVQQEVLEELLRSELFLQQVPRDCKLPEGTEVEYTGVLFQPVPWSVTTKKGMPAEIEAAYYGKEGYTFINVPPVFMFQAKIFQPPRLCAIYKQKA